MKKKSRVPAVIGIWALIALFISLSGLPGRVPLPLPQILIAGLTVIFPLGLLVSSGLRQWISGRDLYGLTLFHLWRILPGIVFLQLHQRQLLPRLFAVPAGWGDIIVAVDGHDRRMTESQLLEYALWQKHRGDAIGVTVLRDGERKTLSYVLP